MKQIWLRNPVKKPERNYYPIEFPEDAYVEVKFRNAIFAKGQAAGFGWNNFGYADADIVKFRVLPESEKIVYIWDRL